MRSIDVVVPCYKYGRFLPECVNSVLSQAGVDVRVLVIDDCSPDDSFAVAESLARADGRVTARRHEKNRGHIATYNEGLLDWATATYSLLLSADDALVPGALDRATRLLEANPSMSFAYGRALVVQQVADATAEASPPQDTVVIESSDYLEHVCRNGNGVPTPTAVVRTALLHKLGGYKPSLPHSGDMEMWMRLASAGPVGILKAVQGLYRWHGGNMGGNYYAAHVADLSAQLAAGFEALPLLPAPEAARLRQILTQRVAQDAFWTASAAFDAGELQLSEQCLTFARTHDPSLPSSRPWLKMKVKRMMGPSVWKRLRSVLEPSGGTASSTLAQSPFRTGTLNGWYPGA